MTSSIPCPISPQRRDTFGQAHRTHRRGYAQPERMTGTSRCQPPPQGFRAGRGGRRSSSRVRLLKPTTPATSHALLPSCHPTRTLW